MRLTNIGYFTIETLYTIKRNWLVTLAGISMTFMTMFVFAMSIMFAFTLNSVASQFSKSAEITVYLNPKNTKELNEEIGDKLQGYQDVKEVTFVSSEEALDELSKTLGKKKVVLETVNENPIPHSFRVSLARADQIEALATEFAGIDGVYDIIYARQAISNLLSLSSLFRSLGFFLSLGLGIGSFFIIFISIAASIESRETEIAVMILEGSTPNLVRLPFGIEGVFYGLLGSIPAVILANVLYSVITSKLQGILMFMESSYNTLGVKLTYAIVISAGVAFGLGGSILAIRKHLNKYLQTITESGKQTKFSERWRPSSEEM